MPRSSRKLDQRHRTGTSSCGLRQRFRDRSLLVVEDDGDTIAAPYAEAVKRRF
jgi:hypothetical protein